MDIEPTIQIIDSTLSLLKAQMKGRPNEKDLEPALGYRNRMVSDLQGLAETATKKDLKQLGETWRTWVPRSASYSPNPAHRFVEMVCEAIELW